MRPDSFPFVGPRLCRFSARIARSTEPVSRTGLSTLSPPRPQSGPRDSGFRLRLDRRALARGRSHALPGQSPGIRLRPTCSAWGPACSWIDWVAASFPRPIVARTPGGLDQVVLKRLRSGSRNWSRPSIACSADRASTGPRQSLRHRTPFCRSARQRPHRSQPTCRPVPIAGNCSSAAAVFPSMSSGRSRVSWPPDWPHSNRGPVCTARFSCRTCG